MRCITIITTGGTIEKTYDERTGRLENRRSILGRMLRRLRLEETRVRMVELMSKDSLEITDSDRARLVQAVREACERDEAGTVEARPGAAEDSAGCDPEGRHGVVVLHGTDTLSETGEAILRAMPEVPVAVVLTGAMRPYEMKRSDALQNLTEAVFASGVLEPGVYFVGHGRALRFPGVVKDRELGTFVRR